MVMFGYSQVPHGLWKKAIKIIHDIHGFLEVVVKNDRLEDKFRTELVVSMLRNEELNVMKIAKQACYQICSICDIWLI